MELSCPEGISQKFESSDLSRDNLDREIGRPFNLAQRVEAASGDLTRSVEILCAVSGVYKGGFSKGGFSNNGIIVTHKLLNPPLLNPLCELSTVAVEGTWLNVSGSSLEDGNYTTVH